MSTPRLRQQGRTAHPVPVIDWHPPTRHDWSLPTAPVTLPAAPWQTPRQIVDAAAEERLRAKEAADAERRAMRQRILEILANGPMHRTQLRRLAGMGETVFDLAMNYLRDRGLIYRIPDPASPYLPGRWAVTPYVEVSK